MRLVLIALALAGVILVLAVTFVLLTGRATITVRHEGGTTIRHSGRVML